MNLLLFIVSFQPLILHIFALFTIDRFKCHTMKDNKYGRLHNDQKMYCLYFKTENTFVVI